LKTFLTSDKQQFVCWYFSANYTGASSTVGHCSLTGSFHVDLLFGNNRQVSIYELIPVSNPGSKWSSSHADSTIHKPA